MSNGCIISNKYPNEISAYFHLSLYTLPLWSRICCSTNIKTPIPGGQDSSPPAISTFTFSTHANLSLSSMLSGAHFHISFFSYPSQISDQSSQPYQHFSLHYEECFLSHHNFRKPSITERKVSGSRPICYSFLTHSL